MFACSFADSDNESKDGSGSQEKKSGRLSQPINTIAYTVSYTNIYIYYIRFSFFPLHLFIHVYMHNDIPPRRYILPSKQYNTGSGPRPGRNIMDIKIDRSFSLSLSQAHVNFSYTAAYVPSISLSLWCVYTFVSRVVVECEIEAARSCGIMNQCASMRESKREREREIERKRESFWSW